MPNKRHTNAVRLEFTRGSLVQTNLSGGKPGWIALYDAPGASDLAAKNVSTLVVQVHQVVMQPLG